MYASPIKTLIKSTLRALSLDIRRIEKTAAVPPVYQDVQETHTRLNCGQPAAYLCPIGKLCTFSGFSLGSKGWHPFVVAVNEYLHGHRKTYSGSMLEKFYNSWQPADALEALIAPIDGPALMRQLPDYTAHQPSHLIHPEQRQPAMQNKISDQKQWASQEQSD